MEAPAIVLDNGTAFVKCGFSGTHFPACVAPTIVGTRRPQQPRQQNLTRCLSSTVPSEPDTGASGGAAQGVDCVCGDDVYTCRDALNLTEPVANGIVQDMERMQELWNWLFFRRLGLSSSPAANSPSTCATVHSTNGEETLGESGSLRDRSLLLSETPLFNLHHRCQLLEVMLETYGFGRVQTAAQGMLSIFSAGLETGVAVECGEGLMHCTAVFEGYALPKANRRVDVGGRDVTTFLARLLQRRGGNLAVEPTAPRNRAANQDVRWTRALKERLCYAAVDWGLEQHLARHTACLEKPITLPDGSACTLGEERYLATEALFRPALLDVECGGLSEQLWDCIQAADIDVRAQLFQHVVLSGGSTMFAGFCSRIEGDLLRMYLRQNLKGDATKLRGRRPIRVAAPPRRRHMVFLGGAALAELTMATPERWLTRHEWMEGGEGTVRARFADGNT